MPRTDAVPPCPRCGEVPPLEINPAVSLTAHYEERHPTVPFVTMASDIVRVCSPAPLGPEGST